MESLSSQSLINQLTIDQADIERARVRQRSISTFDMLIKESANGANSMVKGGAAQQVMNTIKTGSR